jgi:multidrug efflux pump subunit AcrB
MKYLFNLMTSLSLRFRWLTIAIVVLFLILGTVAAVQLNQELLPPIEFPQTVVLSQVSGLTSEQVMTILTERLEGALIDIEEVINLDSTTTGSFGTVIIAYNDFGINKTKLQDEMQLAVDNVWLPLRRIEVSDGSSMLADLTPDVLIYMAEVEPNFLFRLDPEVWQSFSDDTLDELLAYLATRQESASSSTSALEQFVNKEIVPQLFTVDDVVNVVVDGGQALPDQEDVFGGGIETAAESLLLRLSPPIWEVISARVDGLGELNQDAVDMLSNGDIIPSTTAPQLPESWRQFEHFYTADDLLEIGTFTMPAAEVMNHFYETGSIVGALGQTDDINAEIIINMLEIEAAAEIPIEQSMLQYFEDEHLAVLPQDVLDEFPDEYISTLSGFTRDALAARSLAQSLNKNGDSNGEVEYANVDLPTQWQFQPPQLISFGFADLPLAVFNVSISGDAPVADAPSVENTDTEADAVADDEQGDTAPALPDIFSMAGPSLGVELDSADDLLSIPVPEAFAEFWEGDTMSASDFLNFVAAPEQMLPEGAELPFDPSMMTQMAPMMIGGMSPDIIVYLDENDSEFLSGLFPEVFAFFGEDVLALESVTAAQSNVVVDEDTTSDDAAPALPGSFAMAGDSLGVTLDSADDLLTLPVPEAFAEFWEGDTMSAADFFNFIVAPEQVLSEGAELPFDPSLMTQMAPMLLGPVEGDVITYLDENDSEFITSLFPEVFAFFSEDVQTLDIVLSAQGLDVTVALDQKLGDAWNGLSNQPQFADTPLVMASDLIALGNGSASDLLEIINDNIPDQFTGYEVRLFDNLTPEIIAYFHQEESDFYANLDAEVLLEFSQEVLAAIPEDVLEELDTDVADQVMAIANGETDSAFTALQTQYSTNLPPADPDAPALNVDWLQLEPHYAIELDSADDFFRFPEGFPHEDISSLINGLLESPQGAGFVPVLLGNMPVEVMEYTINRDVTVWSDLSPRALLEFSEEVLVLLPEELQQRAVESGEEFKPERQITRTNGQPSLFVSVYKNADANTVTAYGDVEELLMEEISGKHENINIGVVFEQSSFIEESVSGVAREGGLGAVFAVVIILIFLSSGVWNMQARRQVGLVMIITFALLLLLLIVFSLSEVDNDWGAAFDHSDIVFRVLLIGGIISGFVVLVWPGSLPDPAWRATIVIAVSIPLSILTALAAMNWFSPVMYDLVQPLSENSGFSGDLFSFILRLFPEKMTLNILTLSGLTVAVGRVVDDSIVVLENIFRQLEGAEQTPEAKRQAVLEGTRDVSSAIFIATIIAVVVFLPLGLTGGIIGAFFLPFGLAVTYALAASFIVAVTIVPVLAYMLIDVSAIPEEEGDIWVARYYVPMLRWSLTNWKTKGTVIFLAALSFVFAMMLFAQRPAAFIPSLGEPQIAIAVALPSSVRIVETNEYVAQMEQFIVDSVPAEKITALETTVGGGGAGMETMLFGSSVSENMASITVRLDVSSAELDEWTQLFREEAESIFNCPDVADPCADDEVQNNVVVSAASISEGGMGGLSLVASGPVDEIASLDAIIIETLNSIEGITNVTSNLSEAATNGDGPITYIRVNMESAISYTGELETENTIGVLGEAITAVEVLEEVQALPNVTISQGYQSEMQTEGFNSMPIAMGIAMIIVIAILIFTFQSLVYWLALILSVIVAPVGAAVALTLADRVLGISAMIGLLMLLGLVITNAVVLLDRVRSNMHERNLNMYDALVEAGGRRLRPILMTSLATIIALIPLAIGLSEGAIIASELGTVVIGGVVSSTLLTLIVVPVMYSLLTPLHRLLSFSRGPAIADDKKKKNVEQ